MRIVEFAPAEPVKELPPFGGAVESHILQYRNTAARTASAAAWTLLYNVLQTHGLPVGTVVFGEHGKPYFSEGGVFFSLSHAGGLVAVSVADVPTGVDIERCDRKLNARLIERSLTPTEKESFDGDFIRLWCRKESIVKLTGEGIYGYPDRIESGDPRYEFRESVIRCNNNDYRLTAAFLFGDD